MKICSECKWFYQEYYDYWFEGNKCSTKVYECRSPNRNVNMITGETEMLTCHEGRTTYWRCGKDGLWFDAK